MNKRTIGTLLIVLTVILQSLTLRTNAASQDFQAAQTYWGSAEDPLEASPGDKSVTLNVVIQNKGSQAYSGLDATLYLTFPFSDITGGNVVSGYYSGSIPVGQTATLRFQLNIDADGSIGSYSLIMSIRYGTGFELGTTVSVPVLLLGRAELEMSINPSSLSPGSMSALMVTVSNKGTGTASKVSIALTFPTGVSIGGDNQWYFQSIRPNEDKAMMLDASAQASLAGSSLKIDASITYTDAYGTSRTSSRAVGLRISPTTNVPLVMTVKGNELQPGMLNTIAINILNNQTKPVSFVQALLTLPSGQALVVFSDNSWFFRSIDPLKSATFNAQLMVSSTAADTNYQLTLTLSYLDPYNISRTENHAFGVHVLPAPKNVLLISVDRNILIAGSFNEPKITMSNSGKAPIGSITVTLSFPTAPGASTSASTIVLATGNQWYFDLLQPNSNVTFSPKISATLGAIDTSYQAQLSISYTDEHEISRVETKTLGFSVRGIITFEIFDRQVIPKATFPGGNITITGNLLNTGSSRALYMTVTVKPSPYFTQSSDGPIYIGEVPTNTPTPFTLSSRVRTNAANGTYPLTLSFNYQNDYGDKYVFENALSVTVGGYIPVTQRPSGQPSNTGQNVIIQWLPYIVPSIVAVSAIFLVYRRRKRRQK